MPAARSTRFAAFAVSEGARFLQSKSRGGGGGGRRRRRRRCRCCCCNGVVVVVVVIAAAAVVVVVAVVVAVVVVVGSYVRDRMILNITISMHLFLIGMIG